MWHPKAKPFLRPNILSNLIAGTAGAPLPCAADMPFLFREGTRLDIHQSESWFTVDEKEPIAYVKVEVIEEMDVKPADLNGLSDPYVKGQVGPYRFRTKTQKKTLAPKWQEEFKIP